MSKTTENFVLLIERGQTRFPERPISENRFLIGAGSNCQLQLAGDLPILHSIIVPEGDHLWIDAVVPNPPLLVNGEEVRESPLHIGDVIEIGTFVFCMATSRSSSVPPERSVPSEDATAEELVDAMAEEMEFLESVEENRTQGADALLETIQGLNPELAELIQLRESELDRREAELHRTATQLESTQREMQRQLAALAEQLGVATNETTKPLKISA